MPYTNSAGVKLNNNADLIIEANAAGDVVSARNLINGQEYVGGGAGGAKVYVPTINEESHKLFIEEGLTYIDFYFSLIDLTQVGEPYFPIIWVDSSSETQGHIILYAAMPTDIDGTSVFSANALFDYNPTTGELILNN